MQIRLFGGVAIEHDGLERVITQRRLRIILSILTTERGQPVSAGRLIDLLWPEEPPPSAETSIHVAISKLRRLLEPDLAPRQPSKRLATIEGGYLLDITDDQLDIAVFENLAREALRPGTTVAVADRAWATWTGDPFGDLLDAGWAQALTKRLQSLRQQLLARRAELALETGDGTMTSDLMAELERHPFDERLAGLTMLTLYGVGRQAEALDVAQTIRRDLREQLGLDPTRELQRIEQSILERDPSLQSFLTQLPTDAPQPQRSIELLGRDEDLERVEQSLHLHDLVTLVGPAGCGKTTLARLIAERSERARETFVDLSAIETDRHDQERIARVIADALGLVAEPARTTIEALRGALARRPSLLVLDNCEQVAEAVGHVAAALSSVPGVRVLATSRRSLGRVEEAVIVLPPLAVAPPGAAEAEVRASPACQLLEKRGALAIDSTNFDAMSSLARRLDGLPLALELAAHRLQALGPVEVLRQVMQDRDLEGPDGSAPGHQSLDASLRRSLHGLSDLDHVVLDTMATFVGPVPLAAISQLAQLQSVDEASRSIELLATRHLVYPSEDGRGRFAMLETVRASRRRLLNAADTSNSWRQRHVAVISSIARAERAGTSDVALADVDSEIGAALDHLEMLAEPENGELHHQLVTNVGSFWYRSGRLREAQERMQSAIAIYPDVDPLWRGITLAAAGLISFSSGAFREIDKLLSEAVEVLGGAGLPGLELLNAARHCSRKELDQVDENVAIALASGAVKGMQQAIALDVAAYSAWFRGDYPTAITHFEAQQRAADAAGDRFLEGRAIRGRGLMLAYQGQPESGAFLCEDSVRMIDDWENDRAVTQFLAIRAAIALEFGNLESARGDAIAAMRRASVRFDGNPMMVAVPVLAMCESLDDHHQSAARATAWLRGICAATGMYLPVASERLTAEAEQAAQQRLSKTEWTAGRAAGASGGLAGLVDHLENQR